jgi:hypothetical protein
MNSTEQDDGGKTGDGFGAHEERGEELLALLRPDSDDDRAAIDGEDEGPILDGAMLAGIAEELSQRAPSPPIARGARGRAGWWRRSAAPWLVFGAVLVVVALAARREVSALSDTAEVHQTVFAALADELREKERTLAALQASHQEELARLTARLERMRAGLAPAPGRDVPEEAEDLVVRIEEIRAEAARTDLAAERLAARGQDRGSRRDGVARLDDNPYDGVSSATSLNDAVWDEPERERAAPDGSAGRLDLLIDAAIAGPSLSRPSPEPEAPAGSSALPRVPTKGEVSRALDNVADAVRRCAGAQGERLVVSLVVSGSTGRVIEARTVDPDHRGTAAGACASRAVLLAKFPRFLEGRLPVKYPFDLLTPAP